MTEDGRHSESSLAGSTRSWSFGAERKRRRVPAVTPRQSLYDRIALSLALSGALIGPWLFGGVRLWSIGLLLFFTFCAAILTALRPFLFRMEQRPLFPAALPFLALFLAYAALRIPTAAVPSEAVLEVVRLTGLVASFWVITELTGGHHGRWRWVMGLLLMSVSLMCLYALVQHFRESEMVLHLVRPSVYEGRASGAFICPNHFASLIGLVLPVAFALALCRDAGYSLRIFSAYTLLVIPPALLLTQSRSGWQGALAGFLVAWLLHALYRGRRQFLITMLVAPVCAAGVVLAAWNFSPVVRTRVEDALRGNTRLQIWTDTLDMIHAAPLTGHGAGSYRWVYPRFWQALTDFTDPEHAHNESLELLAEHGALGAALFIVGLAVAAGALLLRLRAANRDRDAALIAGVMGAGTAAVVHSCFDYNFHVHGVVSALILPAGVATSALFGSQLIRRKTWCSSRMRQGIAVAIILLSTVCLYLTSRAVVSDLITRQADVARDAMQFDRAERLYARAAWVDPGNFMARMGHAQTLATRMRWNLNREGRQQNYQRAEELYRETLRINPEHLDAEVSLALLYSAGREEERALETLRKVVARAPRHRENVCLLGLQLRRMDRQKEAMDVFLQAEALGTTEVVQQNLRELRRAGVGP